MSLPVASITVTHLGSSLPARVIHVTPGVGSIRYDVTQTLNSTQQLRALANAGLTITGDRVTLPNGKFIWLNTAS